MQIFMELKYRLQQGGLGWLLLLWGLSGLSLAGGSGPIDPFPITGAFSATHSEDRDNISIIEFAGDYNRSLSGGQNNIEPRAVVAQEFLRTHPDNYDFIVTFSTFEFDTDEYSAFHWGVRNSVQGIGLPQYDVSHLFGSNGKLQGYIDMAALSRWSLDPFDPNFENTLSALLHETLHQWGSFIKFRDSDGTDSDALLGRDLAHWSALLDSGASVEYGAQWRDNGDGSYTSIGIGTFYSPLDLYLMGLYRADEVPPLTLLQSSELDRFSLPQGGVTIQATPKTIRIDEIIAANGARVPAMANAQKRFRFAFVLLKAPGETVSNETLAAINQLRRAFTTRFAILTGGRGIAEVFPEAQPVAEISAPTIINAGPLRNTQANLDEGLAWLRAAQTPDGFWEDKPTTRVRDTTRALALLSRTDPSFTGLAQARAWLDDHATRNTDDLARYILALREIGQAPPASLLNQLRAMQKADGGWGLSADFASDVLDTALALRALASADAAAVSYLLSHVNPDGGWGFNQSTRSYISVTMEVLRALDSAGALAQHVALKDAALQWLTSVKGQSKGGFGDEAVSLYDTALVVETLVSLNETARIDLDAAIAVLLQSQSETGSWAGSIATTSTVISALRRFDFSNWRVRSLTADTDVVPNDQDTFVLSDGQRTLLTAVIQNDSHLATRPGVLRFFDGDPAAGGVQIGADISVPVLGVAQARQFSVYYDALNQSGEHQLFAVVDPDNTLLELSETDNQASVALRVNPAPAGVALNVTAADIVFIPAIVNTLPATLGININVRNAGLSDANAVRVVLRKGVDVNTPIVAERTLDILNRSTVVVNFTDTLTTSAAAMYTVQLDADNAFREDNENNNLASATFNVQAAFDLSVADADITLDRTAAFLGEDISFTVQLHNRGTLDVPAAEVTYLISDGVTTQTLPATTLNINAGTTRSVDLVWRANLTGNLTFSAQWDPANLVPEFNENNNLASQALTVNTANGANLTVDFRDFTFTPNPAQEGAPNDISVLVRNIGSVAADNIDVAVYDNDPAQGGTLIGSQTLASLAANAQTTVVIHWPQVSGGGDKLLFAVVDAANTILETNEQDNRTFNILPVVSLPDLAIAEADVTITPAFPRTGDSIAIAARVFNRGQQSANNITVRAFNGDPANGGVSLGDQIINGLAAGENAVVSFTTVYNNASNTTSIVLQVDPDAAIAESQRNNNTARRTLSVQNGNAFVDQRYFSPNGDDARDSVSFSFRLSAPQDVTVQIVDAAGVVVRTFQSDSLRNISSGNIRWDGLDDVGRLVGDGDYRLRVVDSNNAVLDETVVNVDTNRSSLIQAIDSAAQLFTNLTCKLPIYDIRLTADDSESFFHLPPATASAPFQTGVYRMQSNGTDIRAIVPASFFAGGNRPLETHFSADGSTVFFKRLQTSGQVNVIEHWVVQRDGSNLRQIFSGDSNTRTMLILGLSTNGSRIYYQELLNNNNSRLWSVDTSNNTAPVNIFGDGTQRIFQTQLSPDARYLAFVPDLAVQGRSLAMIDLASGQFSVLLDENALPDGVDTQIVWSPNSELLAVYEEFGRRLRVLQRDGTLRQTFAISQFNGIDSSSNVVWSSSNQELALRITGYSDTTGGIYVGNILTGHLEKVTDISGVGGASYHISTWDGSQWVERGVLHYDRFFRERQFDLSEFLPDADGEYKVRIRQFGQEAAHVDSVSLLGDHSRYAPAAARKYLDTNGVWESITAWFGAEKTEDVLAQARYADNEVFDAFGSEFVVTWQDVLPAKTFKLALNAREETLSTLNALPFDYPPKNAPSPTYPYTLGNTGALTLDGELTGDDQLGQPLFKVFTRPDTGHPPADVYGYVSSDTHYLYAALDFTVDNTLDGSNDWAKLRVRSKGKWHDYTLNVDSHPYGVVGFTKTDKVNFTHKVYEFRIPLSELAVQDGDTVEIAFQAYGTAAQIPTQAPLRILPSYGDVVWVPNERTLIYTNGYEHFGIFLDQDRPVENLFTSWPTNLSNLHFSPAGRKILFDSDRQTRQASDACFGFGFQDRWSFESLFNLVADLRPLRSASRGGVILRGSASDLNLDSYILEYREVDAPDQWQLIAPAANQSVIDDEFTTWVPPQPGTYFVRLTVTDLAGNRRQVVQRVSWNDTPSITDLYRTSAYISPNADGVQDSAGLHLRVLEPTHVDVNIFDSQGQRVRTLVRDYSVAGSEDVIDWDGRNDLGIPVEPGEYRIAIQDFDFFVTIDNTPPQVTFEIQAPYQIESINNADVVRVKPALSWRIQDSLYDDAIIQMGDGDNPVDFREFFDPDPNETGAGTRGERDISIGQYTRQRFRLEARDKSGNTTVLLSPLPREEQLIVFGMNDFDPDDLIQRALQRIPYVPFGDDSGGNAICCALQTALNKRLGVAESIRAAMTELHFEYRRSINDPWQAMVLPVFSDQDELQIDAQAIRGGTYIARLRAVDSHGTAFYSNSFRFANSVGVTFGGLVPALPDDADRLRYINNEFFKYGIAGDNPLLFVPFGKLGDFYYLWGRSEGVEGITQVQLLLSSVPDFNASQDKFDPRYATEQVVDTVQDVSSGVYLFRSDALASCKNYRGRLRLLGGLDANGERVIITATQPVAIDIPCLDLSTKVNYLQAADCGAPSPNKIQIQFAPHSVDFSPLKLLTFGTRDANTGVEDIVFNVNNPQSVAQPRTQDQEPTFIYTFELDTSGLPEGELIYEARLFNVNDEEITQPIKLLIDHTPATADIAFPAEGQAVCGVSRTGTDGVVRNIVALDAVLDDANSLHYQVEVRAAGTGSFDLFHDSRAITSPLNSFDLANGIAPVIPEPAPRADLHATRINGPIAQLFDRSGEFETRLRVFDNSGEQRCVVRRFSMDSNLEFIDSRIDQRIISPNGDGTLDEVVASFEVGEPVTVDIGIYATQLINNRLQRSGTVITQVTQGLAVLAGESSLRWNGTDSGGATLADGTYAMLITLRDACGNTQRRTHFVTIDTSAPSVAIHSPAANTAISLITDVVGNVQDTNLKAYQLAFSAGTSVGTLIPIATGASNQINTSLGNWNTFGLLGPHVLQLSATDIAGNTSTTQVVVDIAQQVDLLNSFEAVPGIFSPNQDGRRESTSLRIGVAQAIRYSIAIHAADTSVVRTLASDQSTLPGTTALQWDGRNDAGIAVADGRYTATITAQLSTNPAVTQTASIVVVLDTTPYTITITQPQSGFAQGSGSIIGTLQDANPSRYILDITATPQAPLWTTLSSGTVTQDNAVLANVQDLAEGDYALRVITTDQAENQREQIVAFSVDNTAPTLTFITPAANDVVGAGKAPVEVKALIDEVNLNTYSLSIGSGVTPTTWTELINATIVPSNNVLTTLDTSAFADGVYTLRLQAYDKAGNNGEIRQTIVIDNTPPLALITAPSENGFISQAMEIIGSASDAHFLSYTLSIAPQPRATASRWSELITATQPVTNAPLLNGGFLPADGVATLRLQVTDAANNVSEQLVQLTVDTHPPAQPVGLSATIENKNTVHLRWQANSETDLAGYALYRNGVRITTTLINTAEYVDTAVAEGTYVYSVSAFDHANQESERSDSIHASIDITPPTTSLIKPSHQQAVSGLLDIIGSAHSDTDFKEYRLFIGAGANPAQWQLLRRSPVPVLADILTQWDTTVLAEGSVYSLKLESEDISGNIGTATINVTIDNQPPAAPTGLVAVVNGTDVNLSWNANSETDLFGYLLFRDNRLVNVDSVVVGDLRAFALDTTSYPDAQRPDGTYVYSVFAIDAAGNISDASLAQSVTIDTQPPHVTLTQPQDGDLFETSQYVLAESDDNDIASVVFEYKAVASTAWTTFATDTQRPYEANFDPVALTLTLGDYQLRAIATDNHSAVDPAPTLITLSYVDITPPATPSAVTAQVNAGDVTLTWDAGTATDLQGYIVERIDADDTVQRLTATPITQTNYIDTGLADAVYRYQIRAVDTHNNESAASIQVAAVVYTPLIIQPFTPTADAAVSFIGTGVTTAEVTASVTNNLGTTNLPVISLDENLQFVYTGMPLAAGDNSFRFVLTDNHGNISKAAVSVITRGDVPSQPTGANVAASGFDVSLNWNPNPEANILGYRVFRNGESQLPDAPIAGLTATTSSFAANYQDASQVLDSDVTTSWLADNNEQQPWLELRAAATELMTSLQINWFDATFIPPAYSIQAWSGHHWITLITKTDSTDAIETINLPTHYRTDRLRVQILIPPTVGAFTFVSIREVTVMARALQTTTSFMHTAPDGHHAYTVTAVNDLGFESIASAPATIAVGDVTPPDAVTLSASVTDADVQLDWTPSVAVDVAGYDIYRDGERIAQQADLVNLRFTDTARTNGTYLYNVHARDVAGNTLPSNDVSVTVNVPVATPLNLNITGIAEGGVLDITWQAAANVTGYRLLRALTAGGPYTVIANLDASVTSYRDTDVVNGTDYYYVVVSEDALGNVSADSNEATGLPQDSVGPALGVSWPTQPGLQGVSDQAFIDIAGQTEVGAHVTLQQDGLPIAAATPRAVTALIDEDDVSQYFTGFGSSTASPDGRHWLVVFGGLILHDLAANTQQKVADLDRSFANYPSWSQDGRFVVYTDRMFASSNYEINILEVATGDIRTPINNIAFATAMLSPDNTQLVLFGQREGQNRIWQVDIASGQITDLVTDVAPLTGLHRWSPDGTKIAYLDSRSGRSLRVVDVATKALTIVATGLSEQLPNWSLDSNRVIYTVDRNGTRRVIEAYAFDSQTTQVLVQGNDILYSPAFSPDGVSIFYWNRANQDLYFTNLLTGQVSIMPWDIRLDELSIVWTRAGYIQFMSNDFDVADTYYRIAPAGRYDINGVQLHPGDNILTLVAEDAAGNLSNPQQIVVSQDNSSRPDLSIVADDIQLLPVVPLINENIRVAVSVRNTGKSRATASSLSLIGLRADGSSDTLLDTVSVPALAAGASTTLVADWSTNASSGIYNVIATVDVLGTIDEISEINNTAIKDVFVANNTTPQLTVSVDQSAYSNNQDVAITTEVINSGVSIDGQLDVQIEDTAGIAVRSVQHYSVTDLAFAERLRFVDTWNTGNTFAGHYQVHVRLRDTSGQLISETSVPFVISAISGLSSTISPDQNSYQSNEDVTLTATVDYAIGNTRLSGVTATLRVTDAADEVLAESTQTLGDLLPGSNNALTLIWNTGSQAVGSYHAQVDVHQGQTLLSTASTDVSIVPDNNALNLRGTVSVSTSLLTAGTPLSVNYAIVNEGNAAVASLPVVVSLFDSQTQVITPIHTSTQAITTGASVSNSINLVTDTLRLQSYTVLLQVERPDANGQPERVTLASAPFTLVDRQPPVVTLQQPLANGFIRGDVSAIIRALDTQSGIDTVEINIDNTIWLAAQSDAPALNTYRRVLQNLTEGVHTLRVRAHDNAANLSEIGPFTFTVDNTLPEITVTGVTEGVFSNTALTPVINIHETNLATSSVTLNGAAFTSGTPVDSDGSYVLNIVATDKAGNTATQTISFHVDVSAPDVVITSPIDGITLGVTATDVQGSTEPSASVTLTTGAYQATLTADANGVFQFVQVPLVNGSNTIEVVATDSANNHSQPATVTLSVVTDTTAALAATTTPANGVLIWWPYTSLEHCHTYSGDHVAQPALNYPDPRCHQHNYTGEDDERDDHRDEDDERDDHRDEDDERDDHRDDEFVYKQLLLTQLDDTLQGEQREIRFAHDHSDFLQALRSQRYGVVVLVDLQDHTALQIPAATRNELDAMVVSGLKLVWINTNFDNRTLWNAEWQAITGTTIDDADLQGSYNVVLTDTPHTLAGNWPGQGRTLKLTADSSATGIGVLQPANNPAMVYHRFGVGQTVTIAFNPAQLQNNGGQVLLTDILVPLPLPYHPALPGSVHNVTWAASGLQAPLNVQLVEELAPGLSVLRVWDGNVLDTTTGIWQRTSESDQVMFRSIIRLSDNIGAQSITARLSQRVGEIESPLAQEQLSFNVFYERQALADFIIYQFGYLETSSDNDFEIISEVMWHIQLASEQPQNSQYDAAFSISHLNEAVGLLNNVTINVIEEKLLLGYLLRMYQATWTLTLP